MPIFSKVYSNIAKHAQQNGASFSNFTVSLGKRSNNLLTLASFTGKRKNQTNLQVNHRGLSIGPSLARADFRRRAKQEKLAVENYRHAEPVERKRFYQNENPATKKRATLGLAFAPLVLSRMSRATSKIKSSLFTLRSTSTWLLTSGRPPFRLRTWTTKTSTRLPPWTLQQSAANLCWIGSPTVTKHPSLLESPVLSSKPRPCCFNPSRQGHSWHPTSPARLPPSSAWGIRASARLSDDEPLWAKCSTYLLSCQ